MAVVATKEGAGRVYGPDFTSSGTFANASCPLIVYGNDAGTMPLRLSVTPSINCWWPVNASLLAKTVDANWGRAAVQLYLSPADPIFGINPEAQLMHHSGTTDWASATVSALFALSAGVAYTVTLRIGNLIGPAVTWQYHRYAAYTYINSPGIVPR